MRRNQITLNLIRADGSPNLIWAEDMIFIEHNGEPISTRAGHR
jgi:hypothetical protein